MARALYDELADLGLLEYGSTITVEAVQKLIGIEVPDVGTAKVFRDLSLREVAAIDQVRDRLLDQGKTIKLDGTAYRIPLPSENAKVIADYHASARRKLKRAERLARSSPSANARDDNQFASRGLIARGTRSIAGSPVAANESGKKAA